MLALLSTFLSKIAALSKQASRRLASFTQIPADKPYLLKAQFRAFSQQMPMMYAMLMASMWAVAVTFLTHAPLAVVIVFPIIMTVASAFRMWQWHSARHRDPMPEVALRAAKKTCVLAALMASGFVIWAVMLFPYGDAYSQSLLAFFLATAIMTCVFCLMHNKPSAFIVFFIVNCGLIVHFGSTGVPALIATTFITTVAGIVLLIMLLINHRDFTQMVEAQVRTQALSDENFRLANLDTLTGLPNRRAFFAHLIKTVDAARQNNTGLALGIVDLDGFKPVNDLYGHPFGDKLLIEVGSRLSDLCRAGGAYIARLGGDEFALIIPGAESDEAVMAVGQSLCEALHAPFQLPEATVQIAVSIGFAMYPQMAQTPVELFERADYALYDGKRGDRRGKATLFTAKHVAAISRDARIEQALKMADLDKELEVFFQPIVDVASARTVGFEALARWTSPTLGKVPPGQFIPVAERAGFIGKLTRPLLTKALAVAATWPENLRLSFNLSAYDLGSEENVLAIISIIENSRFSASRLDLEITETAFGHDFEQVRKAANMLKYLGCGISLDDFGTGYSSLSRLHALPLTKIKIDRSFVVNLHRNSASAKIVKSLLALSRDMGLDCIVEGIETGEEMAALSKLGGMMVQGYFYSPPVAAAELDQFFGRELCRAS